jgi:subtilase family serine protease
LRLPRRVGDGRYCLQTRVDPRDELRESDETDNSSMRAFRLRGDAVSVIDSSICAR